MVEMVLTEPVREASAPTAPAHSFPAFGQPEAHICQTILGRLLPRDSEYQQLLVSDHERQEADARLLTAEQAATPAQVFNSLRWGGLALVTGNSGRQVADLADCYGRAGFALEQPHTYVREGFWGLPLLSRKRHFFVARKVMLIPPGDITERFTYQVQLARQRQHAGPVVVVKEVPSFESVLLRLQNRRTELPADVLERRARKFTSKIFPTFLTREAGILKILQERLPEPYARRVPHVIDMERDDRGFVRRLRMNWLRNTRQPLSHLEFAHQSCDLLRMVHDCAKVIHLDLRLDNFVITDQGVGFVDFGSSVRENEDLSQNPLLEGLFGELMRTSQIQRMLEQMTLTGHVTSHAISRGHRKIDKAVDLFYLAVQFNSPHANPDLAPLIEYDRGGPDARQLSRLTQEILRPVEPERPVFRTAQDILRGLERIRGRRS